MSILRKFQGGFREVLGRYEGGMREVSRTYLPFQDPSIQRHFQRFREVSANFRKCNYSGNLQFLKKTNLSLIYLEVYDKSTIFATEKSLLWFNPKLKQL
jgi:hypothetical protein